MCSLQMEMKIVLQKGLWLLQSTRHQYCDTLSLKLSQEPIKLNLNAFFNFSSMSFRSFAKVRESETGL